MLRDSRYALGDWFAANLRPNDRIVHHGLPWKLPALPAYVTTLRPECCDFNTMQSRDMPEWFVVMPIQEHEVTHEHTMTDKDYNDLVSAKLPYRLALKQEPKMFFRRRPIAWVNPPYEVYVREDLVQRISSKRSQ
jgi:hypothetical protein